MGRLYTYGTLILILVFSGALQAQAPQVLSVFPSSQEIAALQDDVIRVTFDQSLDLSTVDYTNFKVFGRWSGPAEVAFSLSNNNRTVEMTPFEPLMAGEWVTVTLSKNIKSVSGENMETAYVWNFWMAVQAHPFNLTEFSLIKTILLRNPGEGLLRAYGAYAGDLNNDGFSDLTVINETSDDLRILLNDGTGDYEDFEIIETGDASPSPNEGADFDNDGEIDLAVCTAHHNELRVHFGDGTGTLLNQTNYTTGMNARGLGIIELDGDGNDDIVVANRGSSDLSLFQNDGFGNFTATTIDPTGSGESGLVVTDFNNDGIQDIIVGMYSSNEILVLEGDGNMNFTEAAHSEVNGQPWMLAAGDLNGDGFADVVSANSSANNLAVLLNNGNGDFEPPVYLTESNAVFPLAIDLGDLDGDIDLDIVATYYSSSNYIIFYNNGDGTFISGPVLEAGANASCAIIHDRDNDGDLDITGTDEGDDLVFLFESNPLSLSVEEFTKGLINIEPNPFKDFLRIEFSEICSDCTVELYNGLGNLLFSIPVDQQEILEISLENNEYPPGIYYLKFIDGNRFEVLKMVKM